MSKITLIDLSSIFWQQWHATADKEIGSAYEATVSKIYKFVNGSEPVAICVDRPPYKRKAISADYKANRDKPSPVAIEQLQRVIERLENDGFPVLGVLGYEADDIIASICKRDTESEILIVSSDKDILQLVTDKVHAKSPLTLEEYDAKAVFDKFGCTPDHLGNFLAMLGDKSDNVPGVPGVGKVGAVALLIRPGWDNLMKLLDIGDPDSEIAPPSTRQNLIDNYAQLLTSRKLVELMDTEIDIATIHAPRVPKKKTETEVIDVIDEPEETKPTENTTDKPASEKPKTEEKQNALAKVEPSQIAPHGQWSLALEPTTCNGAWQLSKILYESRLYQKFSTPNAILAVIMRGRALGLDATTALSNFHVVEGQPTPSASLIVGLVLRDPSCDYFECIESTPQIATYITHRKGSHSDEPKKYSYTIEMAANAGLLAKTKSGNDTNWHKRPETMLRHRCETELARMVYPDITAGLYTPEEISDGQYAEFEVVQ